MNGKRQCCRCVRYKAFYTKGNSYFDKRDVGFCQIHKKIVGKNESCEHWGYNIVTKQNRKRVLLNKLDEVLTKLNVIEQTLRDEIEQDEINYNEIR